jgi:transcriptional regulator with XRE-family HTH domain
MKPIYLRTAREQRRWTQARLAEISRVPQHVISKLETRVSKRASYLNAAKLAEALGIPIGQLRLGPDPARAHEPQDGRQRAAQSKRPARQASVA